MSAYDVVVVGAGAAGLAALNELTRAGCRVCCIEARDRLGGRIYTVHDPLSPAPVELGAEFIHGRPPEIWNAIRSARMKVYDCADSSVRIRNGAVRDESDSWQQSDAVMDEMCKAAEQGDEPFAQFLSKTSFPPNTKQLATSFVEGFNAARAEVVGIASLALDTRALDEIDGDRSFRLVDGYEAFVRHFLPAGAELHLNRVLESVHWRKGAVELSTRDALSGEARVYHARKAILTVPLGVLQSSSIAWDPAPQATLDAARALAFGQVIRLVLRFAEPFWEGDERFANAGFLLSDEKVFPTWWTTLALRSSQVTAWSAGPRADPLLGKTREEIVGAAIHSLARILDIAEAKISGQLRQAHFHDWHSDPFARGAYSYVPAGALPARRTLAEAVEDTLYFAGEATELEGHSATVHGAISSGIRAGRQIIASER